MNKFFSMFKKKEKVRLKTDKLPFFKRILVSSKSKFNKFKKYLKEDKEFNLFLKDIFSMTITGFLGTFVLMAFGLPFKIIYVLAIGGGLFLLITKILPEINKLLSSINLVRIMR